MTCNSKTSTAPISVSFKVKRRKIQKPLSVMMNGDRQESLLKPGTAESLGQKCNFIQICLEFIAKGGYSFR